MRVLISLHPCQHLLLFTFLIIVIVIGAKWYFSCFWFAFYQKLMISNPFSCAYWQFVHIVRRKLLRILYPFFRRIICLLMFDSRSSLYTLVEYVIVWDTNSLLNLWFANIFFHWVGYLFTFLNDVLWSTKDLMVDKVFIFPFVTFAFCVISEKTLPYPKSWKLTPRFSSKSFIVLVLIFSSVIHFELIFAWVVS